MMPFLVYTLCAVTCTACAFLLLRAHQLGRNRLLYWSGLGFTAFAIANVMLCVDLLMISQADLSLVRNAITLAGIALMLRGLIWERMS